MKLSRRDFIEGLCATIAWVASKGVVRPSDDPKRVIFDMGANTWRKRPALERFQIKFHEGGPWIDFDYPYPAKAAQGPPTIHVDFTSDEPAWRYAWPSSHPNCKCVTVVLAPYDYDPT